MRSSFSWRKLVRPEILLLVGVLQANFPYLLWRCGYPVLRAKSFNITYKPLYFWIFAYIAFCLGTTHVSFCLTKKTRKSHGSKLFHIKQPTFRLIFAATIVMVILQIILACRLYGVLPFLGYFSEYRASILNEAQESSFFGQLGLLTVSRFALTALILIGIISNFKSKARHRKILWIAIMVLIFSSLFSGKTQAFFIFLCFLLVGCSLTGSNPVNLFMRKMKLLQFSKKQTILLCICLLLFLIFLHGFTRFLRRGNLDEFSFTGSVDSVIKYLSFPLINMEFLIANSSSLEPHTPIYGLFGKLFPYKSRSELFGFTSASIPRLIISAPSGFFAAPLWYLGFWGMLVFMFIVGVVCKCLYIKANSSLFCLLAYSQIAWTLVAAHTYNHFLHLIFIPAPIIAFFILTKIIGRKRVISRVVASGPGCFVESQARVVG